MEALQFENRIFADIISYKIRSYWNRVDPKSSGQCPYKKAMWREGRGRGWRDAASHHQGQKDTGRIFPSNCQRRCRPTDSLILDFWPPDR